MELTTKPSVELVRNTLPPPLYKCLEYLFNQNIKGIALSGGTALAGFYAAHRKSDDLDLFTQDENSQKAAVLAVKSLKSIGVLLQDEFQTNQYYRATCEFQNHKFTIDIVLDTHFFEVGHFEKLPNGIVVASLETILMTKAATLVSRCSEKDLYDLMWICEQDQNLNIAQLIELGHKIDGGMNGEAILLSISGTRLKKEACGFSLSPHITAEEIYKKIISFQREFILQLNSFLKNQPPLPLKRLIQRLNRLK